MDKHDVTDFLIRSNARMKNLRSEYGYSYKKLAELTGISSSTLQRYENNPFASIPLSKIKSIAKAYNVSPGYLMGWESRYLSNEDLEGLSKLLDDIGYDLNYDEITETFVLKDDDSSYNLEADQLKLLKTEVLSFVKYKLLDIIESLKKKSENPNK